MDWFLQIVGASLPNSCTADTLDEAKTGIGAACERVRGRSK
jgi:hypothetical protein